MQLTQQELDFLLDAVDALEAMESTKIMNADMLAQTMCRTDEERRQVTESLKKIRADDAGRRRVLRERCIVIKAKLLQCRDAVSADRPFSDAQENKS